MMRVRVKFVKRQRWFEGVVAQKFRAVGVGFVLMVVKYRC